MYVLLEEIIESPLGKVRAIAPVAHRYGWSSQIFDGGIRNRE